MKTGASRFFMQRCSTWGSLIALNPVLAILCCSVISIVFIYPATELLWRQHVLSQQSSTVSWVLEDRIADRVVAPEISFEQFMFVSTHNVSMRNILTMLESAGIDAAYYSESALRTKGEFWCQSAGSCVATSEHAFLQQSSRNSDWHSSEAYSKEADTFRRVYVKTPVMSEHVPAFDSIQRVAELHGWVFSRLDSPIRQFEARSTRYELVDKMILGSCYAATFVYVILSLQQLQLVKSKFGLACTSVIQVMISSLAARSALCFMDYPDSIIPPPVFPFVVTVIDTENTFRLIKAVVNATPSASARYRIAEGISVCGPKVLKTMALNLVWVFLLANTVAHGVERFCVFVMFAVMMDSVLTMSFFTAVMSVDIRRLELQDLIHNSARNVCPKNEHVQEQSTFIGKLKSKLPLSTNVMSTIILTLVIVGLQYTVNSSKGLEWSNLADLTWRIKLFGHKRNFAQWMTDLFEKSHVVLKSHDLGLVSDLTSYLKLHARDRRSVDVAVRTVLLFVEKGAVDTPNALYESRFPCPSPLDNFKVFLGVQAFVQFSVLLLLQKYLLKGSNEEAEENIKLKKDSTDDPLISISTARTNSRLDIVALFPVSDTLLLAIDLSRNGTLFDVQKCSEIVSFSISSLPSAPQHAVFDKTHSYLCLLSQKQVDVFDLASREFIKTFRSTRTSTIISCNLSSSGVLSVLCADGHVIEYSIAMLQHFCTKELPFPAQDEGNFLAKATFLNSRLGLNVACLTKSGKFFSFIKQSAEADWISKQQFDQTLNIAIEEQKGAYDIIALYGVPCFAVLVSVEVLLCSFEPDAVISRFEIGQCIPHSLRISVRAVSAKDHDEPIGLDGVAIAYNEKDHGILIVHQYTRKRATATKEKPAMMANDVVVPEPNMYEEEVHWKRNAGAWEMTALGGFVFGIRPDTTTTLIQSKHQDSMEDTRGLRRAKVRKDRKFDAYKTYGAQTWEVWYMDPFGNVNASALHSENSEPSSLEMISDVCCRCRISSSTVVFAAGTCLRILDFPHSGVTIQSLGGDPSMEFAKRRRRQYIRSE